MNKRPMTVTDQETRPSKISLDPVAARALAEHSVVRELDRSGNPHVLVKVPDLDQSLQADVGMEIQREEDGCIAFSLLIYDIPAEPVSYDLRFYPDDPADLQFLQRFLDTAQFRLYPCQQGISGWEVGAPQTFRIPANVLLRLKHFSLEWPHVDAVDSAPSPAPAPDNDEKSGSEARIMDPRDTVIRKLKEQVQTLRSQLQERDKRIIELEDEVREVKSKGRGYRLSGERKAWWKPF